MPTLAQTPRSGDRTSGASTATPSPSRTPARRTVRARETLAQDREVTLQGYEAPGSDPPAPHPSAEAAAGISASSRVPLPAGLCTRSWPPSPSTRSATPFEPGTRPTGRPRRFRRRRSPRRERARGACARSGLPPAAPSASPAVPPRGPRSSRNGAGLRSEKAIGEENPRRTESPPPPGWRRERCRDRPGGTRDLARKGARKRQEARSERARVEEKRCYALESWKVRATRPNFNVSPF